MSLNHNPLGEKTDYPKRYAPEVLFGIPRLEGRALIGLSESALPFSGVDIWTHYEVSWLDQWGKPCVAIGELRVPADSPHLIESKSMKLYFNSLNFERFNSAQDFCKKVERDLSQVAGVSVQFSLLDSEAVQVATLEGICLDTLPLQEPSFECSPASLRVDPQRQVSETVYSHLLRSLCPVTQQPDWGSVCIRYTGSAIDHLGLLAYIVSYRDHADFHEQCVERIFMDVLRFCQPSQLTVFARYTRRGGLDINPFRSNAAEQAFTGRMPRQ